MNNKISTFVTLAIATLLYAGHAFAGEQEKIVIQLKTDDFELAETDISELGIGESETIVTESGKIIDLLRTPDGVEIYVDGELMDVPGMGSHDGHHGDSVNVHKSIMIECEVEGDEEIETSCAEDMHVLSGDGHKIWFSENENIDLGTLHEAGEGHKIIRIHKSLDVDADVETIVKKVIIIEKD
jgi:hypothetical protein